MTRVALRDDDPRHGDANTYRNKRYACRCDRCREAHRIRCAEERADRIARGLPMNDPRHGTHNGRINWGCGCTRCRRAESDYHKAGKRMRGKTA